MSNAIDIPIHSVGPGSGWRWLVGGYRLFSLARWKWLGLSFCFLLLTAMISALMSIIPVLGSYGGSLLAPVFSAGVMLGCRDLTEGRPLMVGRLVGGFNEGRLLPLLLVGGIWCAGVWAIVTFAFAAIAAVVMPNAAEVNLAALILGGFSPETLAALWPLLLAALLTLLLFVPLAMALWFAPQLVQLRSVAPVRAVGLSLVGCVRNTLPFLIYGLLLLLALCGLGLVMGLTLMALVAKLSVWLMFPVALASLFLPFAVVAIGWASAYVGYVEIFPLSAATMPCAGDPQETCGGS